MLISMTGYGSATRETQDTIIKVEFKSLNSRTLDLNIRIPRQFSDKEINLRTLVSNRLERGKVAINIEVDYLDPSKAKKTINRPLLMSYIEEIKSISAEAQLDMGNILPSLLNIPDVLQSQASEPETEDWQIVEEVIEEALSAYDTTRKREGEILEEEIRVYVQNIQANALIVQKLRDLRLPRIKDSLREKLADIINEGKLDEVRFEQELIYYADKLDISEEMVRLQSHIDLFMQTLNEQSPGKKIGFILQEMGREINTTGSKANDAEIAKCVVIMKEELEKIKEQTFNIL